MDFANGGGISGMNSGFTGSPSSAPEGVQIAFIQTNGEISQSISGFQANSNYVITFSAAQRSNCCNTGGQDIQVYLDSDLKGTFHPSSGSYAEYSTAAFSTTTGAHTVKFVGLNPGGGDHTAFIDNIRINGSPKPGFGVQWLLTDQLGTPRMVFDESGALANVKRHDYLPFGEDVSVLGLRTAGLGYSASDGVRQQFTEKERDFETGLDYFLARYYSSIQGRFTSPDEFKGGPDELFVLGSGHPEKQALVYANVTNPQSLNKYQYTFNNPLRYVDPSGQTPQDSFELNFNRDVKDLLEKRITEEEFRSRMNSRGVGAAIGAAIVAAYIWGPEVATAIMMWATRNPEKVNQLAEEAVQFSSGNPAPAPGASASASINLGRKLEYLLGNATGNPHNIQRSTTMASELGRIGLQDSSATRQYLTEHLYQVGEAVAQGAGAVQKNGNILRESLLFGPGGAVKLKTIWQKTQDEVKLITIEVLRGK